MKKCQEYLTKIQIAEEMGDAYWIEQKTAMHKSSAEERGEEFFCIPDNEKASFFHYLAIPLDKSKTSANQFYKDNEGDITLLEAMLDKLKVFFRLWYLNDATEDEKHNIEYVYFGFYLPPHNSHPRAIFHALTTPLNDKPENLDTDHTDEWKDMPVFIDILKGKPINPNEPYTKYTVEELIVLPQ